MTIQTRSTTRSWPTPATAKECHADKAEPSTILSPRPPADDCCRIASGVDVPLRCPKECPCRDASLSSHQVSLLNRPTVCIIFATCSPAGRRQGDALFHLSRLQPTVLPTLARCRISPCCAVPRTLFTSVPAYNGVVHHSHHDEVVLSSSILSDLAPLLPYYYDCQRKAGSSSRDPSAAL